MNLKNLFINLNYIGMLYADIQGLKILYLQVTVAGVHKEKVKIGFSIQREPGYDNFYSSYQKNWRGFKKITGIQSLIKNHKKIQIQIQEKHHWLTTDK